MRQVSVVRGGSCARNGAQRSSQNGWPAEGSAKPASHIALAPRCRVKASAGCGTNSQGLAPCLQTQQ